MRNRFAVLAYASMIVGLNELVLPLGGNPWRNGAIWGLLVYGTWGGTASALIPQWPEDLVFKEILWGAFLGGAVARYA